MEEMIQQENVIELFENTPEPKNRKTPLERIRAREARAVRKLLPIKERMGRFRRITAGDYVDVENFPSQEYTESDLQREPKLAEIYETLNRRFEPAKNNYILQNLRTIIQQVSYRFPSIEFEDLPAPQAAFNSIYLTKRLGRAPVGCNAIYHERLALCDMLIGGVGATRVVLNERGRPADIWIDSIDVWWDVDSKIIQDASYIFVDVYQPLWQWLELFPKNKGLKQLAKELASGVSSNRFGGDSEHGEGGVSMDTVIRGRYYWDTEGGGGTEAVLIDGLVKPVHYDENYYRNTLEEPYLPVALMTMMSLPGAVQPFSMVEQMLPAILFLRNAEGSFSAASVLAKGLVDVEKGAYDEKDLQMLLSGKSHGLIFRNQGKPPASFHDPIDIPKVFLQLYEKGKENLTANAGVDPFASGNKVNSVNYAAEVTAIQNASGLNAGAISAEVAAHWSAVCAMMLQLGAIYDDQPLRFYYDDVLLTFGPDQPISKFLNPDGMPLVVEDSTTYQTPDQKQAKAYNNFKVAMEAAAINPALVSSVMIRYEEYLKATQVSDTKKHFEPPTMEQAISPEQAGTEEAEADTGGQATA